MAGRGRRRRADARRRGRRAHRERCAAARRPGGLRVVGDPSPGPRRQRRQRRPRPARPHRRLPRRRPRRARAPVAGLVGRRGRGRPRRGHRPLVRGGAQRPGRLPGHDRAGQHRPGRPRLGQPVPRHHRAGPGGGGGRCSPTRWASAAGRSSSAGRWAGCGPWSGRSSHPGRVDSLVVLASTAAASGDQIAWCAPQLAAITSDPAWLGGDYHDADGDGPGRRPGRGPADRPRHLPLARGDGHPVRAGAAAGGGPRHGRPVRRRVLPGPPGRRSSPGASTPPPT